jgi:hypothetical protein
LVLDRRELAMGEGERSRAQEMDASLEGIIASAQKLAAALSRKRQGGQGLTSDELALVKADKRYRKAWPEE